MHSPSNIYSFFYLYDLIPFDSVTPKADRVDAKANVELHCPYMSEGPFSHDASQLHLSSAVILIKNA